MLANSALGFREIFYGHTRAIIQILIHASLQQNFHSIIPEPVVGVEVHYIVALRSMYTGFACLSQPTVFLMHHFNGIVFSGQSVNNYSRIVGAAVIHYNDFAITIGLIQRTFHTSVDERCGIIGGYYYGNQRLYILCYVLILFHTTKILFFFQLIHILTPHTRSFALFLSFRTSNAFPFSYFNVPIP